MTGVVRDQVKLEFEGPWTIVVGFWIDQPWSRIFGKGHEVESIHRYIRSGAFRLKDAELQMVVAIT